MVMILSMLISVGLQLLAFAPFLSGVLHAIPMPNVGFLPVIGVPARMVHLLQHYRISVNSASTSLLVAFMLLLRVHAAHTLVLAQ